MWIIRPAEMRNQNEMCPPVAITISTAVYTIVHDTKYMAKNANFVRFT